MTNKRKLIQKILSYVLVATLASGATWFLADTVPNSKLERLADVIDRSFVGQADETAIQDAAADAMIRALGDRWSYYISAENYAKHKENQKNEYVGIGVTVMKRADGQGFDIMAVTAGGPAEEAGVLPGDIFTHADGVALGELTTNEMQALVMGKKNTTVVITLLRGEETMDVTVTRKVIHTKVAESMLLSENVGYIAINNFHQDAAKDTIREMESLLEQGATKLIFDVRDNPGGYVHEMVEILDYLLPAGVLFRSVSAAGKEEVETSDEDCLELPVSVLINGNTYSAAEFFAAALEEYEWAVTVGEPTTGKGYYQNTIELGDGSAVQLSTGAYTTPNGVNLTEVGGLVPQVQVETAEGYVTVEDDPQILAAIQALSEETM